MVHLATRALERHRRSTLHLHQSLPRYLKHLPQRVRHRTGKQRSLGRLIHLAVMARVPDGLEIRG